jgi:SAM-dependent methyltransferase
MSFDVAATAYDRFMGRFSRPLAVLLADTADVRPGMTALDVGCGPGALAEELVARLGADAVTAVDPSEPFVSAARERLPGVRVERAVAEDLPLPDDAVDRALAQLVVHFMSDPVAGLAEMARVTRPDGLVTACVWDHGGGRGPLSLFWRAVHDLDPTNRGEGDLAGTREGQLGRLARDAGLRDVTEAALTTSLRFGSFEEWWLPYELGVGPAGAHVAGLDDAGREALRARCADLAPPAPFTVEATAWCVTGRP